MTDLRRPRLGPFTATPARSSARREDAPPAPSERHGHAAHASPEALAGRPPSTGPAAPRRMPDIRGALGQAGAAQRASLRRQMDTQDATFAHVMEMQAQQVALSTGLAHIVEEAASRPGPGSHEEQLASAMEMLDLSVRHQQATDAAWERFGSQRPAPAPAPAPSTLGPAAAMASVQAHLDTQGATFAHVIEMQAQQVALSTGLAHIVEEAASRPGPRTYEEQLASAMEMLDLSVRHQQATDAAWERHAPQRPAAPPAPSSSMPTTLGPEAAMNAARAEIGQRLGHRQAMRAARQEIGNRLSYEAAMAEARAEMRGWATDETPPSGTASRARTRRGRR